MSQAGAGAAAESNACAPSYDDQLTQVLDTLKRMYNELLRPIEQAYHFDVIRPSYFGSSLNQRKPFCLFLGPFSAGKSTFINYLLQSNLLGVGPQPLTDRFAAIMSGESHQRITGRAAIANSALPFTGLTVFGDSFCDLFEVIQAPHPILDSVSVIDTPGVLEAAEGVHARRYDYIKVCRWFVERSDLVFFLFDPTKLDSGPELRMLFRHSLRGFENRIRIILNKADMVRPQELMRVYGALFWNLSTLMDTTEPPRVYVSSFWDKPYKPDTNHKLFTEEKADLLYDLVEVVPLQSLDRRVTHVLKRAQEVLQHTLMCATIRQAMPMLFGKEKAKAAEIGKIPQTAEVLADRFHLSARDFFSQQDYATFFEKCDLFEMKNMDEIQHKNLKWIDRLKDLIDTRLPQLLQPIKTSAVADPNDRKRAMMVQRQYQQQMESQLQGVQGIQGGLGEMAPMPARGIQSLPMPASPAGGAAAGAMTPEMMMAMMQAQQAQQQQAAAQAAQQQQAQAQQAQMMAMMQAMMANGGQPPPTPQ